MIGGIAAVLHGSARNTFDLDLCFATDEANLEALGEVLISLRARLRGVDDVPFVPDAATLRRIEVLTLSTDAGDLDVLARPDGAPTFDVLRRRADRFDVGGFVVRVASLDDLIAMKSAAGRPKDRETVSSSRPSGACGATSPAPAPRRRGSPAPPRPAPRRARRPAARGRARAPGRPTG